MIGWVVGATLAISNPVPRFLPRGGLANRCFEELADHPIHGGTPVHGQFAGLAQQLIVDGEGQVCHVISVVGIHGGFHGGRAAIPASYRPHPAAISRARAAVLRTSACTAAGIFSISSSPSRASGQAFIGFPARL